MNEKAYECKKSVSRGIGTRAIEAPLELWSHENMSHTKRNFTAQTAAARQTTEV
jgi:hypothetical protein